MKFKQLKKQVTYNNKLTSYGYPLFTHNTIDFIYIGYLSLNRVMDFANLATMCQYQNLFGGRNNPN